MRYSFRLAEVVGHVPDPRKRPGTIKAVCDYTGLDRHQVAALLKNEVKYIPLDALSKLCEYLIDRGYASAEELPGRLFGVEPEHFWELLARRKRLVLCLGVRRGEAAETLDDAWVVASDSVLLGELLSGVTTLGGTVLHRRAKEGKPGVETDEDLAEKVGDGVADPHPEHLHQTLVWSPGQAEIEQCLAMASASYEAFSGTAGDKALVCLGSNKSNPVVELLLANAFGCEPFVSQDGVASPAKRSCPIFLRYRDRDPQPPSCCGGLRVSRGHATQKPGIYYAKPNGDWECVPWDEKQHDAAFVFYIHRESQGHMEMALGGFSGRATRMLARLLARRGEEFWPPVYEGQGIQIGAFVVQFTFPGEPLDERNLLRTDLQAEGKIIRLDSQVIAERMLHVAESD
jgi:hypothetical protein